MYRSIFYDDKQKKIHVWGDGQHNDEGYQIHDFKPYAYILDANGKHVTIDGYRCRKTDAWSEESVKMGMVFEHNVSPTTRYLIDAYTDSDEISNKTKVLYIDIEIAKEERYSTPEEADNTITAITYFATGDSQYTCLLLDTKRASAEFTSDVSIGDKTISVKTQTFKTEHALLVKFLANYQKIGHNIITGWNVEFFDMPYLYNRIVKVFDYNTANAFSPDARIVRRKHTSLGQLLQIAGVTVLDYLNLYKKFTYTEQSNYRLDTIAKFELGRGKVEYDGDLDHLYNTDIQKFAEYNVIDVELVVSMDAKMDLVKIAMGLCHKGHCQHSDIQFSSAYLDGAALTYCRRNGLVASANRSKVSDKAAGAFVKKPTPGLYKWVYDLDLTSLYPMNIITLNISPETKHSKVLNWDEEEFAKGTFKVYDVENYKDNTVTGNFDDFFEQTQATAIKIYGSDKLQEYLTENNLSIASNGVTYNMSKPGLIPSILSMWFDDRKRFKDARKQAEKDNDSEAAASYDRQQLITKILLNSFYGVLLLPTFRFYDKDNGEAVTFTGVSVIKWATRAADYFYANELAEYNCVHEITLESGEVKKLNGFDKVKTKSGEKYVFMLQETDELI